MGWSPSSVSISLFASAKPGDDRQFEIHFLDPGAEVFAFTFG
jgi:hypothetical protein